jgi:hypothetical protein
MKLAQIDGGIVVNVAEVDPSAVPDFMADWVETEEAGPGWTWTEEGGFAPPEQVEKTVPVPAVVSRLQARLALLGAGLLQTVEDHIAASGDAMLQLVWAEATEWRRDSPTIATIAAALSLSEDQVDELFISAGAITV